MSDPKVMIGVPMPLDMFIDARTGKWCDREVNFGIGWMVEMVCGGSAARNKNVIVKKLLDTDCTDLFLLNNDTWPSLNTINKLLLHDKDIVAGITPAFNGEFFWMGQVEKNKVIKLKECPKTLTTAARAGGPGMLVKRKVFEKMKFPWFDFVQVDPNTEKSEDYYFSDKAVDLGFEIWIDPKTELNHNHRGVDLLEIARALM